MHDEWEKMIQGHKDCTDTVKRAWAADLKKNLPTEYTEE